MQSELFTKVLESMDRVNVGDVLYALGLKPQRSASERILPMVGAVAIGAAIGAGVALLYSPRTGQQIREMIEQRVGQGFEQLRSRMKKDEGTTAGTTAGTTSGVGQSGRIS